MKEPRRILVVAPNWLGDVVMLTPLLTWLDAVRRAPGGPSLELALAVRAAWAPLFAGDPRVDELLVAERPGRHDGLRGIAAQAARWRQGRFDAALLGPPSLRAALTAALAGVDLRIGHRGDGRSLLLTSALPRAPRGTRHYALEMLDLGAALAGIARWERAALPAPEPAEARLQAMASAMTPSAERPLWALGPGTTFGPAKNWPAAPMAAFVSAAVATEGARVLLLGDAGAAPIIDELRLALPALRWTRGMDGGESALQADVIDLSGCTTLPEAVAWLGRCRAYVGNDSGLMHVAAALGIPTVGLFGSSNPDWTRPSGAFVEVVAADGFACRPCYRRTCNHPVFCLGAVEGERVLQAVQRLLAAAAGRREGSSPG